MEHISKIAFPGLGIGEFELSNVAFEIPDIFGIWGGVGFPVYWYGLIITFGMVIAFLYVCFRGKYENVKSDDILDIALWTIVCGVVGARLYYVLTKLDHFMPEDGNVIEFIQNVINLRSGGLAIYGGIIVGALTIIAVTTIKKMNFLKLWDMAAPGVIIAQSLGRWGNFCNGEAFGGLVEEGHPLYFMRMGLVSSNSIYTFKTREMVYVHPTFLYESLWNVAGFILLNIFFKKKKFNGQIGCMYLAWYGFGRFFIESLRTDSLYVPGTPIRISQMVGIVCFAVFGAALVAGVIYSKKKLYAEGAELNAFDRFIKPDLIMNPVFFEKKDKAVEGENAEEIKEDVAQEAAEEALPKEGEEENENDEDN